MDDSHHFIDYENDYDDSNNVTLSSHHLNNLNNRNNSINNSSNNNVDDEVVVEEVTSEGCEGNDGVKNEGEEVKDDDVASIDFLFNDNNEDEDEDEVDEALHLPPYNTSHNLIEDDDGSLSDLFFSDEEKE